MSDIRKKLILGTTLSALAMIFVMAVGVDAFDTKTTIVSQPTGLNGHVTIWAIHPDGSASYAQGDNTITTSANGIRQIVDDSYTSDPFNCVRIGIGNGAGPLTPVLDSPNGAAAQVCDQQTNAANSVAGTTILTTVYTFTNANVGGVPGGTAMISEADLQDDSGQVLSNVALASEVGVIEGSVLTLNYSMTLG